MKNFLIISVVIYCILIFLLLSQNIEVILGKFLSDDAFYYYEIAKNIVQGNGMVFNQGIPTNGFHPLYLFILLPVFKLFYAINENTPVYASLTILALCNIGTAIFLYMILKRLLSETAGFIAAFFWLFNPFVLFVSLQGMEVPLQIFFISALTYFIISRKEELVLREKIIIGVLLGLIFLSRLDGIFIALAVFFFFKKKPLKDLLTIGSTFVAIILPWLLFSLFYVGRVFPVSGEALRAARLAENSYISLVLNSIHTTAKYITNFFFEFTSPLAQSVIVSIFLIIPLGILIYKGDEASINAFKKISFLFFAIIPFFAFYWFYAAGVRIWYSLFISFLLVLTISILVCNFLKKIKSKHAIATVLLFFIVVFAVNGALAYERGNNIQERAKWKIANFLDTQKKPAGEKIGSFNTGIFQYYTKNQDIINLDGVVNPEACEAIKKGRIEEYILQNKITYIIDSSDVIKRLDSKIIDADLILIFKDPKDFLKTMKTERGVFKIKPADNSSTKNASFTAFTKTGIITVLPLPNQTQT